MGSLDRRLTRISKRLGDFVVGIQRTIIEEVAKEVVVRTPVDTGYARGNWVPGLNAPPVGPVTSLDPQAVASPARIIALAALLRVGDAFFIVNNAPYIELLNRGYSPQAAAGYINNAVNVGVRRGISRIGRLRI